MQKRKTFAGMLACLFGVLTVMTGLTVTAAAVESPDDVVLRFAVLSDVHYGRNNNIDKKFKSALNQLKDKATASGGELDAILFCGDYTQNGYNTDDMSGGKKGEYEQFVEGLESVFPFGGHTQMLFARGNHDCYPSSKGFSAKGRQNFIEVLGKYLPAADSSMTDPTIAQSTYMKDINGFKFIVVGQDNGNASKAGLHKEETIQYAEKLVKEAAESDPTGEKPIFFGTHPHIDKESTDGNNTILESTVYGSTRYPGASSEHPSSFYWATPDLYNAVVNYKQVVTFSGHSHFNITDERSIHQKNFTSLGTGEIAYTELENSRTEDFHPHTGNSPNTNGTSYEDESTGYYIEVHRDNSTHVTRMDFFRKEEIKPDKPWVIKNAKDPNWLTYSEDRDTVKPKFEAGATVEVSGISKTGYTIQIPQAKDDHTDVHYYRLESVNTATGNVDDTQEFFSHEYQNSGMPQTLKWTAKNLAGRTKYKARVIALDAYDNASDAIESAEFTTLDIEPIASAYFKADGDIGDSSQMSTALNIAPKKLGAPSVTYDATLKQYVASFDGTAANFYRVPLPASRRDRMSDGYTIEVYAKYDETGTAAGNNYVIGAADKGGFDFEPNGEKKTLVGWAKHSSGTFTGGQITIPDGYFHYVMTSDGTNITVYKDGVKVESKAISGAISWPESAAKDSTYGMIIGGDYNPNVSGTTYNEQVAAQAPFHGKVAFARIYDGAANAGMVQKLYQSIDDRKNLTKMDELNTMLTVTLPAKLDTEADEIAQKRIKHVMKKGWDLTGQSELTDDMITAYLQTAEADCNATPGTLPYTYSPENMDLSSFAFADYGITYGDKLWSVLKINNDDTMYHDAIRFSTNKVGATNKLLYKLDFASDKVNEPPKLDGAGYTYESELTVMNKTKDAYVDVSLYGKDSGGNELEIAKLRYLNTSAGSSSADASGKAYMVTKDGTQVGKSISQKLSVKASSAATLNYLKVDIDMKYKTFSAWLVKRQDSTSGYSETMPSEATCLVKDQPFNEQDIVEFSGSTSSMTFPSSNTETQGLWLINATVSENDTTTGKLTAKPQIDASAVVANASVPVSFRAYNDTGADVKGVQFIGAVKNNGKLENVFTFTKDITNGEFVTDDANTIALPAGSAGKTLEIYTWDGKMAPLYYNSYQIK